MTLSRNLVQIWIQKFEAGAVDDEAAAADKIEAYETRNAFFAHYSRIISRSTASMD